MITAVLIGETISSLLLPGSLALKRRTVRVAELPPPLNRLKINYYSRCRDIANIYRIPINSRAKWREGAANITLLKHNDCSIFLIVKKGGLR